MLGRLCGRASLLKDESSKNKDMTDRCFVAYKMDFARGLEHVDTQTTNKMDAFIALLNTCSLADFNIV